MENADAIEARLRALKWIDRVESIVELGPAGEGNMNRTLRANLGSRSIVLKQSVPFVAKYPDIPAPLEREPRFARSVRFMLPSTAVSTVFMKSSLLPCGIGKLPPSHAIRQGHP